MDLRVVVDAEAVAREARQEVVRAMAAARAARGRFVLGLAGGRTPRRLYELLARDPSIAWAGAHFLWSDERCVPPGDPASNFRLAHEALLSRIDADPGGVHRLRGEEDPETAAREYEGILEELGDPDLVLLGLGTDGHTASLFPGSSALEEASRLVVPVTAPAGVMPRARLTLTLPALARAKRVLFLVTGPDKRAALAAIREGAAGHLPAARVRARDGVAWLADFTAAA